MDPVTAGMVMGGIQSAGQLIANQQNVGLAHDQMDFQERMSGTAHQREADDLEKAGFNRILTVNSGAPSPPGASAHVENPVSNFASTALQAKQMQAELEMKKDLNDATIKNMDTSTTGKALDNERTSVINRFIKEAGKAGDMSVKGLKMLNDIFNSKP